MKSLIGLKITKLELNQYHQLSITLSDATVYSANISSFSDIYCYPSETEWSKGYIGENLSDVEWPSGFGIHLDQIVDESLNQHKSA